MSCRNQLDGVTIPLYCKTSVRVFSGGSAVVCNERDVAIHCNIRIPINQISWLFLTFFFTSKIRRAAYEKKCGICLDYCTSNIIMTTVDFVKFQHPFIHFLPPICCWIANHNAPNYFKLRLKRILNQQFETRVRTRWKISLVF